MSQVIDGYVRVSRVMGREGDSYISPKVQTEAIQRWAEYKGVTIGEIFTDEDQSGGTHERPGLKLAIDRALSGETSGIVSWKIDRFSRNTEKALEDLRRLRDAGARLAFVTEDIDTGTVYGQMVYTILLAVSEAFLENVKAGWIETKTRAIRRGVHIGPTPFGYLRADDGTLTPDLDVAPVVSEAFTRAATTGLKAAQSYLTEAAPQRGWSTNQVRRILSNEIYLGRLAYGEHAQTIESLALTTRPIWEAAQSLPVSRSAAATFPLSGILTCASCGQHMVGARGGKGQRVYRCSGSLSQAAQRCPTGCVVTADIAEPHVERVTREVWGALTSFRTAPSADLDELANALGDAQDDLAEFMSNGAARRALGARAQSVEQELIATVELAERAYRDGAQAVAHSTVRLVDTFDMSDVPSARAVLQDCYRSITVGAGRGKKRIQFVPPEASDEQSARAVEYFAELIAQAEARE